MVIKLDRLGFLMATGASVMAFPNPSAASGNRTIKPELAMVKACVFDTFGTVVDWRTSVIAEAVGWGQAKGLKVNWVEFTDRWRLRHRPAMDKVRKGEIPWTNLDDLQRMIHEDLLKRYRIEGLTEEETVTSPGERGGRVTTALPAKRSRVRRSAESTAIRGSFLQE